MALYRPNTLIAGYFASSLKPEKLHAIVVAKATYKIIPNAAAEPIPEEDDPAAPTPMQFSGDVFADDNPENELIYPMDFPPMKPRADIVVVANAHAPGGVALRSFPVRVQVGQFAKALTVYGKRLWKQGLIARSGVEDPEPFVTLPISYAHALGGPDSRKNPVGSGIATEEAPRIEDPKQPIRTPRDDSDPAGFGPIPVSWLPRSNLVVKFSKSWVKERWPWLPENFDYAYFNTAPRDQQIEGYLRGDEAFYFENLHPEHADLRGKLPGDRMRWFFIEKSDSGEERYRDVPLKLDTLWVDVAKMTMVLVWRGAAEVRTVRMKEFKHALVWNEPLTEAPRSEQYYRDLFAAQINPPEETGELVPDFEIEEVTEAHFAKYEGMVDQAEKELEGIAEAEKKAAIAEGVDAKLFDPPTAFAGAPSPLAAALQGESDLSPEQLKLAQSMDSEVAAVLAEKAEFEAEMAQDFPDPLTREQVLEIVAKRGSLAEFDLAGVDLSKQNMEGIDFRGANLRNANLSGSILAGAGLAGADMTEADLTGADLSGANLEDADLSKAKVAGAKFPQSLVAGMTLTDVEAPGADFSGCRGAQPNFARSKLAKARFEGVDFHAPDFNHADLTEAIFTGAKMFRADFDAAMAPRANFENAVIPQMSAADGADLTAANFQRARGEKSAFEAAKLDEANFTRAKFPDALFIDASMRKVICDRSDFSRVMFDDADMVEARLTNSNFLRANFERADLTKADLTGSNCYQAGFWDAILKDTILKSANTRMTMLEI